VATAAVNYAYNIHDGFHKINLHMIEPIPKSFLLWHKHCEDGKQKYIKLTPKKSAKNFKSNLQISNQ